MLIFNFSRTIFFVILLTCFYDVLDLNAIESKKKLRGRGVVYDSNISVEKYFHYARQSIKKKNYEQALAYYDLILTHFSDDSRKVVIAEYEKGYVYYVMKKFDKAVFYFDRVIAKSQNAQLASSIPIAILALSNDLKTEIEKTLRSKKKKGIKKIVSKK